MLKTDYLDPEWEGNLVYAITQNTDNTISFTDATTYINSGDYIQAVDINTTNMAVNEFAELYKLWIGGSYTPLPTSYVDAQFEGKKKYRKTDNGDGTVGLEDVTVYTVSGTTYSSSDINTANTFINSFTTAYEDGMDTIDSRLEALGATSVSDFITAVEQMIANQTALGKAQGITDVTTNPNNYNIYTKAQYDAKKTQSNNLKTKIKNAASAIAGGATNSDNYVDNERFVTQSVNNGRNDTNTYVKSGMTSTEAHNARAILKDDAAAVIERNDLSSWVTECTNALNILGA